MIKYELDINVYNKKLIIFNCGFSTKVSYLFPMQENILQDLKELKTFKPRKTTKTCPLLIR